MKAGGLGAKPVILVVIALVLIGGLWAGRSMLMPASDVVVSGVDEPVKLVPTLVPKSTTSSALQVDRPQRVVNENVESWVYHIQSATVSLTVSQQADPDKKAFSSFAKDRELVSIQSGFGEVWLMQSPVAIFHAKGTIYFLQSKARLSSQQWSDILNGLQLREQRL